MKKIILFFFCNVFYFVNINSDVNTILDLYDLGTKLKVIIDKEKHQVIKKGKTFITLRKKLFGENVKITYYANPQSVKINKVRIIIANKYFNNKKEEEFFFKNNGNKYLKIYNHIKSKLISLFGDPNTKNIYDLKYSKEVWKISNTSVIYKTILLSEGSKDSEYLLEITISKNNL
jgi:hypothetical protein